MQRFLVRFSIAMFAFTLGLVTHSIWSRIRLDSGLMVLCNGSDSSQDADIAPGTIPQIRSAAFVGKDQAWLVTWEKYGELWRTEDGGKTWGRLSGKAVGGVFCGISFIDSQRGWAGNFEGQIWHTNDGGKSWTFLSQPLGDKDHDSLTCPQQILFVDEQNGWVIGNFSLWRTVDGGKNWTLSLSMGRVENVLWQPSHISFSGRNVGLMSATGGIVHRTKDGGLTWHSQKLVPGESDATDALFINERVGWLTGFVSSTEAHPGTRLYRTEDGGDSWHQVPIGDEQTYIDSVCFLNEKSGWAVGRAWKGIGDNNGVVLHSDDGGDSWREIRVGANESYFDRMTFLDSQHGWLFGEKNIYRTADGGKSWNTVLRVTPRRITID